MMVWEYGCYSSVYHQLQLTIRIAVPPRPEVTLCSQRDANI